MKIGFFMTLLFLASSILTGCTSATPVSQATTSLTVDMSDFAFNPAEFVVPAGAMITLNIRNSGVIEHNFIILKKGFNITLPYDEDDKANIYWEVSLQAGDQQTLEFQAPEEIGEYEIVCGIPGHAEAGMLATLTVISP